MLATWLRLAAEFQPGAGTVVAEETRVGRSRYFLIQQKRGATSCRGNRSPHDTGALRLRPLGFCRSLTRPSLPSEVLPVDSDRGEPCLFLFIQTPDSLGSCFWSRPGRDHCVSVFCPGWFVSGASRSAPLRPSPRSPTASAVPSLPMEVSLLPGETRTACPDTSPRIRT